MRDEQKSKSRAVKTLLTWSSPARPYARWDRRFIISLAALVFLILLILFLIKDFLPMAVVLSIVFVYAVLASIPPEEIPHKITTQGISSGQHSYLWKELHSFWFGEKYGQRILYVQSMLRFPRELVILLENQTEEAVQKAIVQHLPFREQHDQPTFDKFAAWIGSFLPLETREKKKE